MAGRGSVQAQQMLLIVGQQHDLRALAVSHVELLIFGGGLVEGRQESLPELGSSLAGRQMEVLAQDGEEDGERFNSSVHAGEDGLR